MHKHPVCFKRFKLVLFGAFVEFVPCNATDGELLTFSLLHHLDRIGNPREGHRRGDDLTETRRASATGKS